MTTETDQEKTTAEQTTPEEITPETTPEQSEPEEDKPLFQAIGIVPGEVSFDEAGFASVKVADQIYPLFYTPRLRRAFQALKLEIKNTGEPTQRLIVYPKAIHFPQRNKSHQLAFQLVGFEKEQQTSNISNQLEDFEFQLCGLWQFIPVCRVPVISILRNFTDNRLDYIKSADPVQKVRFMKAAHLPLLWKDSPVKPFRFNPKAQKDEQGKPTFVQVKARFLPQRNVFGFSSLLAPPSEKAPRFLKASKADKAAAQKEKKAIKKPKSDDSPEEPETDNQE
ncbi:MAG: hypothetical protein SAJ12_20690 [Jaaginema sp. PMC 1079.18]|nr:hypothetical protein [Jaaginema sp. PMC 1080.18]MEC4853405.1 hypothetical protein [Jaaginema sp. PMC 1079.18]MEC4864620.1 hypothetical protein [Jaaginema sp. PMC 1078.18]